jgi:hypothetical protein
MKKSANNYFKRNELCLNFPGKVAPAIAEEVILRNTDF